MASSGQEGRSPSHNLSSKSPLGKRFPKWTKKNNRKPPPHSILTSEQMYATRNEHLRIEISHDGQTVAEYETKMPGKETWAKIWLKRLQPHWKQKATESDIQNDAGATKLVTLAEQLREAQDTSMYTSDSKVSIQISNILIIL